VVSGVAAVGALVFLFSIGMALLYVLIPVLVGVFALAALYGAFRSSRFGGASHNPEPQNPKP
jgi:carbon starvation protein CstA